MYFDIQKENNDCMAFNHGFLEVDIYDISIGCDLTTVFNKKETRKLYDAMKKYYDKTGNKNEKI